MDLGGWGLGLGFMAFLVGAGREGRPGLVLRDVRTFPAILLLFGPLNVMGGGISARGLLIKWDLRGAPLEKGKIPALANPFLIGRAFRAI